MKDFLKQDLAEGDYVAGLYSANETPSIFRIWGFTPKKVRLEPIEDISRAILKYPTQLVKLDPTEVLKLLNQTPRDALGQELKVGDCVYGAASEYIDPAIFRITYFMPTVAHVEKIYGEVWARGATRRTADLIKVDAKLLTMLCLTQENN